MASWDFHDGVTIEELDDSKLPESIRGLGIDNIDFVIHCTGYYQPASMYGGPDHLGWPEEGDDEREIVSMRVFNADGAMISLSPQQMADIRAFPDFRKAIESADLNSGNHAANRHRECI